MRLRIEADGERERERLNAICAKTGEGKKCAACETTARVRNVTYVSPGAYVHGESRPRTAERGYARADTASVSFSRD